MELEHPIGTIDPKEEVWKTSSKVLEAEQVVGIVRSYDKDKLAAKKVKEETEEEGIIEIEEEVGIIDNFIVEETVII